MTKRISASIRRQPGSSRSRTTRPSCAASRACSRPSAKIGWHVHAALHDELNRALQQPGGMALRHDACSAVGERRLERGDVLVHGVDDERRRRRGGANAVDEQPLGRGGRFEEIDPGGHEAEHLAQRRADQRMVVDRQDDKRGRDVSAGGHDARRSVFADRLCGGASPRKPLRAFLTRALHKGLTADGRPEPA